MFWGLIFDFQMGMGMTGTWVHVPSGCCEYGHNRNSSNGTPLPLD